MKNHYTLDNCINNARRSGIRMEIMLLPNVRNCMIKENVITVVDSNYFSDGRGKCNEHVVKEIITDHLKKSHVKPVSIEVSRESKPQTNDYKTFCKFTISELIAD